jgi:cytochrome c
MAKRNTKKLAVLALTLALGLAALAACGGPAANAPAPGGANPASSMPAGDATRGEALFKEKGCVGCHALTDEKLIGPGLKGLMDGQGTYGDKLPNGKPLTDDNVAQWIKIGGVGKIGQMPNFPDLSPEQLSDLVAFLKTVR